MSEAMSEDDNEPERDDDPDEDLSIDEKNMAMLAHLGGLLAVPSAGLASFIVPVVIWLTRKGRGGFASTHAKESLNFQITMFLISLVVTPISVLLFGFPYVVWAAVLVVLVLKAALTSREGRSYRYPFAWRLLQ